MVTPVENPSSLIEAAATASDPPRPLSPLPPLRRSTRGVRSGGDGREGGGEGGGVARPVRTSNLRRMLRLFWDGDNLYDEEDGEGGSSGDEEEDECGSSGGEDTRSGSGRAGKKRPRPSTSSSSPSEEEGEEKEEKEEVTLNLGSRLKLRRIHASPHLYVIDDFLTVSELRHLEEKIAVAEKRRLFKRSFVDADDGGSDDDDDVNDAHGDRGGDDTDETDNGKENGAPRISSRSRQQRRRDKDAIRNQRTSTFIHFPRLHSSPIARIEARTADLLGIPHHCIEPLQLVRYKPGEYFGVHHDMGPLTEDGAVILPDKGGWTRPPRRIATLFVYLNDVPEGCGGTTRFPLLGRTRCGEDGLADDGDSEEGDVSNNEKDGSGGSSGGGDSHPICLGDGGGGLDVRPMRGRAVLWCNVDRDGYPDRRTIHAGMPVIAPSPSLCPCPPSVPTEKVIRPSTTTASAAPGSGSLCECVQEASTVGKSKAAKVKRNKHFSRSQRPSIIKYGINVWACEE